MIYTVTCNPSLDLILRLPQFQVGATNRAQAETVVPGGKGVNVAAVLGTLGVPCRALGFSAGFTGQAIEAELLRRGCTVDFLPLPQGISRINVKLKVDGDTFSKPDVPTETEVNGPGPAIPSKLLTVLFEQLEALAQGDFLVLAGSIPQSLPADFYEQILRRFSPRGVRVVVDAAGELLRRTLMYQPFLVKPNREELSELFGRPLRTGAELLACAKQLQHQGAQNVLVSLGGDGALLLAQDGRVFCQRPPQGRVVNSVGAGDSMVAGFLAGFLAGEGPDEALRLGTACGSATAFTEWLADRPAIEAQRAALPPLLLSATEL